MAAQEAGVRLGVGVSGGASLVQSDSLPDALAAAGATGRFKALPASAAALVDCSVSARKRLQPHACALKCCMLSIATLDAASYTRTALPA